ncbi:hypothetical protein Tco_0955020 [Tanacetum coccineum]|uniref:Reverse transcriptase domain-containing protein n=1 Tax=Tanacetum coccineum TaxID=301880 RepID=A0ABQ5E606_9ASTR
MTNMKWQPNRTVDTTRWRTGGWTVEEVEETRDRKAELVVERWTQDGQEGNRVTTIATSRVDVRSAYVSNVEMVVRNKEFMACNPKDYDGKGGAIVYTRWIEKMESVQDMSGCGANLKVKYTFGSFIDFKGLMRKEFYLNNELQKLESEFWCHTMVRAGHVADTDRLHKPAGLVPHLVTPEKKRIERYWYEQITKKRTKNKAKTTKPDTEWKSCKGQGQCDQYAKDKFCYSQSKTSTNKQSISVP